MIIRVVCGNLDLSLLIKKEGERMGESFDKKLSKEYCPRFGQIAVELGFITLEQLKKTLIEQAEDDVAHNPHRLLGEILFEHGRMTYQQIEIVLNKLFKK